jgi:hypothetical protein
MRPFVELDVAGLGRGEVQSVVLDDQPAIDVQPSAIVRGNPEGMASGMLDVNEARPLSAERGRGRGVPSPEDLRGRNPAIDDALGGGPGQARVAEVLTPKPFAGWQRDANSGDGCPHGQQGQDDAAKA